MNMSSHDEETLRVELAAVFRLASRFRLSDAGFAIYTDKTLSVNHYKHISFWGLLKNDFKRSASRARLMLRKSSRAATVGICFVKFRC